MYKILKKTSLNDYVCEMIIFAPEIAKHANPGEFVILRVDEYGERFPLTIADYDKTLGTVTIIFQIVGLSTKKLFQKDEGDEILDFVGPLGNKTKFENFKRVCLVLGGVGSAIGYPILKALKDNEVEVDVILGFRSKDFIILEDKIKNLADKFILTTDDGSKGSKGFVTTYLEALLKTNHYDHIYTIGPLGMMSAVSEITKEANIKTTVSMNPIMIDGTGMCGGCRVRVDGKVIFACVDGPEFDASLVDFNEVIKRNTMYKEVEREKGCRLFNDEV